MDEYNIMLKLFDINDNLRHVFVSSSFTRNFTILNLKIYKKNVKLDVYFIISLRYSKHAVHYSG